MYNDRRKFNLSDKIAKLTPSATPFLTLLNKVPKMQVDDADTKYFEHRAHWLDNLTYSVSVATTISASAAGVAVKIPLKNTNTPSVGLRAGSIIQILDKSSTAYSKYANILVTSTSIDNGASETNVNGYLITNAPGFNVAAADTVTRIGSAFQEGSAKASGYTDELEVNWASSQIFKTQFGFTRNQMKLKTWAGQDAPRIRADKLNEHKVDMERQFIFGQRLSGTAANPFAAPGSTALITTTGATTRTSHGLINAIIYGASNNGIGGTREFNKTKATYTYAQLIDDFEEVFEFGSMSKFALCGMSVISFFNKMALNEANMQIDVKTTEFGIEVHTVKSPAGKLHMVYDPLLRGDYKNFMIVVDMANVSMMVVDDTTLEQGIETPGTDGIEEQYLSDVGLVVKLPETHAIFRFA
jgi:hypothetical protein